MTLSRQNTVLLVMNCGLLAAVIWLWRDRQSNGTAPAEASARLLTNQFFQRPQKPRVEYVPVEVAVTNEFHWRQVESEDYRDYILRLRRIGCPEQTIRDLVIADIDNLLAARTAAIGPTNRHLRYWEPDPRSTASTAEQHQWLRRQLDLDFEKRDVIRELLGVDLVGERMRILGLPDPVGERLGFLTPAKQATVRRAMDQYRAEADGLRALASEDVLTRVELQAQLRQLSRERDRQLEGALTPEERRGYDLWFSDTAERLRDAMADLKPDEEEFLVVFDAQHAFDQRWPDGPPGPLDQPGPEEYQQDRATLDASLRTVLGDERLAALQRGQDPEYRRLRGVARRFQLPEGVAADIHDLRATLQQQRRFVAGNTDMNNAQKLLALEAMSREAESWVRQRLGDRAFTAYRRDGFGAWIGEMPSLPNHAPAAATPLSP